MTFKKKALILSALAAVLALANILTFVFDPGRDRSPSFAWLDPSLLGAADYIEIHRAGGQSGSPVVLVRRNNVWFFRSEGSEIPGALLPAKQGRLDDLFKALSRRSAYPKRAFSASARTALALEEGRASRILVRGGAGLPLLDLLIGTADALGREVYFRKSGEADIYSGEDIFTIYTESRKESWYDLRLFPVEIGALTTEAVQQAELRSFGAGAEADSFILRRQRGGWVIPGNESAEPDALRVESWLRAVLEAEAEDFGIEAPAITVKSIVLHLGDGGILTIQAGAEDENKRVSVLTSGSSLVYVLPEWTVNRVFRDFSYFTPEL